MYSISRSPLRKANLPILFFTAITLLLIIFPLPSVHAQYPFDQVTTCPVNTQRYDIAGLQCSSCGTSQSVQSADFERCQCDAGYRETASTTDSYALTCTSCTALNSTVSLDRSICLKCDSKFSAIFDPATKRCQCPPGYMMAEFDVTGARYADGIRCLQCPAGAQALSSAPRQCSTCSDPLATMSATGECVCSTGYTLVESKCFSVSAVNDLDTNYPTTSAATVRYFDAKPTDTSSVDTSPTTIASATFAALFKINALNCLTYDRHACQVISNLCALQKHYLDSRVCAFLFATAAKVETYYHGFASTTISGSGSASIAGAGWHTGFAFVQYGDPNVLKTDPLSTQVTLSNTYTSDNSKTGTMKFLLAKYNLKGTFLGLEELNYQLQLCKRDPSIMLNYLRFGTHYINGCKINLLDYLNANVPNSNAPGSSSSVNNNTAYVNQYFYDLYLVDKDQKLYPVPVKHVNYRGLDLSFPNGGDGSESFSSSNVLHRRFFLVDNVSGLTPGQLVPSMLSYASKIVLRIDMSPGSNTNIRPPYLVITYADRKRDDILAQDGGEKAYVEFRVEYSMSQDSLWKAAYGLFGTSIGLGVLLALKRMWAWQRKNYGDQMQLNLMFTLRLFILIFASIGDFFFISMCGLTFYTWLFYKGQATVYYLLPPIDGDEVKVLGQMLIVVFVAKTVEVLFLIFYQIRQEVFLIDWEKPKNEGNNELLLEEGGNNNIANSVSVWRKLFAANQLNQCQTIRMVNVPLLLFWMIFLLEGLGLKNLATAQPSPSNLDGTAAPIHPLLSFAVISFLMLSFSYLHWLWSRQIWRRYFRDEISSFVDLLCTSNISCWIFDERYHAYYIHGKTVHSHADVTLEEMNHQIHSEEKTWTRERGLLPGKDTFECFVTPDFRTYYDKEYANLLNRQLVTQSRSKRKGGRAAGGGGGGGSESSEKIRDHDTQALIAERLIRANNSLNSFFTAFIDKHLPQFPYDFGTHDPTARLFGLPTQLPNNAPCTFFDDPYFNFTSTMLLGIEHNLILMNTIIYVFFIFYFNNSILVPTIVCFIIDHLIKMIRGHWGQINISRKTLLDDKFLL